VQEQGALGDANQGTLKHRTEEEVAEGWDREKPLDGRGKQRGWVMGAMRKHGLKGSARIQWTEAGGKHEASHYRGTKTARDRRAPARRGPRTKRGARGEEEAWGDVHRGGRGSGGRRNKGAETRGGGGGGGGGGPRVAGPRTKGAR